MPVQKLQFGSINGCLTAARAWACFSPEGFLAGGSARKRRSLEKQEDLGPFSANSSARPEKHSPAAFSRWVDSTHTTLRNCSPAVLGAPPANRLPATSAASPTYSCVGVLVFRRTVEDLLAGPRLPAALGARLKQPRQATTKARAQARRNMRQARKPPSPRSAHLAIICRLITRARPVIDESIVM